MTTDGKYRTRRGPLSISALAGLVATELSLCDNDHNSEIIGNASDAYNYFLMRKKGDEELGKSSVQDGTVADVIDAVMAELQPMYTVDELVEIKPEGPHDRTFEEETKAINWYFRERLRGYELLDESVQNTLLLRNGYLKIWPESTWRLPYEMTLEGTEDEVDAQLAEFIQRGAIVKEYERETTQEAVFQTELVYDETGIEMIPQDFLVSPAVVKATVQIIEKTNEVKGAAIAREDFGVSNDCRDQNLQKARFSYHRRRMTRNEAIALGFYPDDIYSLEGEDNIANQVRAEREEGIKQTRDSTAADRGGDIVSIYECYYKVDTDGDEIAEMHQIFYGRTNKILRWVKPDGELEWADQIVRVVPTASGIALRVANRHLGRSLFDKLKSTEDVKRALKRQMNDNMYQANDREFLVGPGVSEDDFELGFSGGYKRCQDVNQVRQIEYNPIINESLSALNYYDTVVSDRGGAALDTANSSKPTNVQASSFERWMTATERTTGMYARNIANSLIRDAFVLLHMALKTLGEPFDYEDGDEWKKAEPRFWMERERFSVKLGKSEGERNRLIGSYENQIEKAAEIMQNGGDAILTDWSQMYEMLTDQANLMGVQDHWLDPNRVVSQQQLPNGQVVPVTAVQAAQQARQQAAQEQAAQAERQGDKLLTAQMQITQLQEETKRLRDMTQAQIDFQKNIQASLDSIRDFVTDQTKLEVESGQDIAGGVLYEDEELAGRVRQ